MVNTGWVGRPEIIIAALFLGRNLCDLLVGVHSSILVLHHLMGMYSILTVSTIKPYRDRYLGNHCAYLVFMETGSMLYNFYALWPRIRYRNLYFYSMTTSNMFGIVWHWIARSIGEHRALHDPKVFFTCIVGSVINCFRQKEVFVVCGYPKVFGGSGFQSPEFATATLGIEETTKLLPIGRKKGNLRYAVQSGQKLISTEIIKNE